MQVQPARADYHKGDFSTRPAAQTQGNRVLIPPGGKSSELGEKLALWCTAGETLRVTRTGSVETSDLRGFEMTANRQRLVEWPLLPLWLGRL